jgi:surfactin synthase thioesterase subunit
MRLASSISPNTTLTTFAALNTSCAQRVPIRLTLIRAQEEDEVLDASRTCGWEQVAMHGVEVLWAPGDHETMFLGDKLEVTTELVRRTLRQADLIQKHAPAFSSPAGRADSHPLRAGSL